ncbi:MAG TPA: hypothetical protein VEH07_04150 [Alphaproteobacteria bacterium]|nr:hypothetical protein [Alphaproteobacteria bacterium]
MARAPSSLFGHLFLLVALVASIPNHTSAADVELVCSKGFDALLGEIKSQPETEQKKVDTDQFEVYAIGFNLYSVTTARHPAHPTIVRRQIIESKEGISLDMTACSFGDKKAFDALMKEFEKLNEAMKRQIQRDHH